MEKGRLIILQNVPASTSFGRLSKIKVLFPKYKFNRFHKQHQFEKNSVYKNSSVSLLGAASCLFSNLFLANCSPSTSLWPWRWEQPASSYMSKQIVLPMCVSTPMYVIVVSVFGGVGEREQLGTGSAEEEGVWGWKLPPWGRSVLYLPKYILKAPNSDILATWEAILMSYCNCFSFFWVTNFQLFFLIPVGCGFES